ncbi:MULTISPECIES: acetyl-CoA carboxylase biotin carboxyl carrier protein [Edaphocola]|jgi:acetyl-CoA carboxylase biotin carboxyl carrier protein|uniref:acetyl-CoA carboxylase biotin carboxyl carrier protein n=1 Tax=Edaphocola TaxID=2601681 RepID=UPI000F8FF955|nr:MULTISPECIES: acetyl-CoA carboxylase biotin carboxyl carrier protein [Edaphocola]
MEYKQIQELLKAVNKSNISELSIKDGDFEITIKQATAEAPITAIPVAQYQPMPQVAPVAAAPVAAPAPAAPAAPVAEAPAAGGKVIKSPMIGTFYRSSSPDKPPFVGVGDEIKAGDVVCIVEAMKLFNEIESDLGGRIVKVLVDDGTPVEYDQPLFIVE